jgi:hypothetical protein
MLVLLTSPLTSPFFSNPNYNCPHTPLPSHLIDKDGYNDYLFHVDEFEMVMSLNNL